MAVRGDVVAFEPLLPRVSKPARYTGGEWNSIVKEWDAVEVRIALAYPDVYDIGMSNLGLGILYDLLNRHENYLAERVYAPWADLESEMRKSETPLWSLETHHAVRDFDAIGFSLSYEMDYTNILNMLDLAGVTVRGCDRGDGDPIVLAGGSGAFNPEPMAAFIDVFALGEGEELIQEFADVIAGWNRQGGGKRVDLLRCLAGVQGCYVPSLYEVEYKPDGTIERTRSIDPAAPPVAPAKPERSADAARGLAAAVRTASRPSWPRRTLSSTSGLRSAARASTTPNRSSSSTTCSTITAAARTPRRLSTNLQTASPACRRTSVTSGSASTTSSPTSWRRQASPRLS